MVTKTQQRITKQIAALLLVFFIVLTCGFAQRAPNLLVIEYIKPGDKQEFEVTVETDDFISPLQGVEHSRIAIHAGDIIKSERRPKDRSIQLFRGTDQQRVLLCSINIKYYRVKENRWQPRYHLHQEPVLAKSGGQWRPAHTILGSGGIVMLTSSTLPNAEGYYQSLEFGMSSGGVIVDSWQIN